MSVWWATAIPGRRCSLRRSLHSRSSQPSDPADEGNTITDFDEEEIQRKITISTAVAVAEWKKTKINLLDTPGFNIFINDTRAALRGGRLRADRGRRRCRRRSADREGLVVRGRVQAAARLRHQ